MLTCAKACSSNTCRRNCLPQQRKSQFVDRLTKAAKSGRYTQSRHTALRNKRVRSNVCRATGVAEVAPPEESELFVTNDGVIEAVDDDEAEVGVLLHRVVNLDHRFFAFEEITHQQVDFLGESTSGNLRLVQRVQSEGIVNVLGLEQLDDIVTIPYNILKTSQQVCPAAITFHLQLVIPSLRFNTPGICRSL